ncbi:class I SAM-dependent methyltransferase [Ancylobacter sp. Lp-2]|uniref:class I SAM-dependent methyltransferase n=1 Tax=Ancylobacter sp. Lp-2 TaxID=2881339 RepID=UPI001E5CE354|nr:class I SAM-dependent methyltransferase [Ancylobacter sp. Lp-2]MCB4770847.1 class I SAM-dependent methyltransferase [Ancylobacter sp. Lp-2]
MTAPPPPQKLDMFGVIQHIQGDAPWGSVLDAGTGVRSARWISGLPSSRWTAVSADPDHLKLTEAAVATARRPQDRLVLGNWQDPALLAGESHDTVLAEYLLGAVESYAPYFQSDLFARLRPLVGGRLYVVGVDPYVNGVVTDETGALVQAIGRLRDACALLAGVMPYREYPAEWVIQRLEQVGLRIVFARRFPNIYDRPWVKRQLDDSRRLVDLINDPAVAQALTGQIEALFQRAEDLLGRLGGLAHGHDYVIAAVTG